MPAVTEPTDDLVRVRRRPERGTRDRAKVEAILDAGLVCHLGYLVGAEQGGEGAPDAPPRPVVVPTLYGRDDDALILHGSAASTALRTGGAGIPVCATVTILDGLVLARSAFHHSVNYRSVVVHGSAEVVAGDRAKRDALRVLTEHVAPGRWDEVRQPTAAELRATTVLRLPLTHAVAKARDGGVGDDPEDLELPVWAGVVPLATHVGAPEPDGDEADLVLPAALAGVGPEQPLIAATGVPAALTARRHGNGTAG